ncbi:MAG TPA: type II toxin-antitoxin system RelE/ParE family toxin [Bacteroidia bacterium]|nr:type II toxin-antitoxin system RelE/ParE family toxin [Bacteroidia bacterium]
MAGYQIEFSTRAAKEYKRLPQNIKTFVDVALTKLSEGGHLDIKPLKGERNTYRIRVGSYRILYLKINDTYLIVRIAHRQNVYN